MESTVKIILTFISGGAIWEGFKFIYPDLKRPIVARIEAKKTFYKNLDPILKSSSELYGKLLSLAREDFATLTNPANSISADPQLNKKYILYLFAQFWAHIEYLRIESHYIALSKIKNGKRLLQYIDTIESRQYRILDRSVQRIIGECIISSTSQKFIVMPVNEFISQIDDTTSKLAKWIQLLDNKLSASTDKEVRQEILRYGIIVAALIDDFDPKYKTVRNRPIYTNKLSAKSKTMIKNNLMKYYLPFIKNQGRYYE
ncbi:hypothetical protein [Ferruginibacter sp.]|nr:hypothetical protein [Ferruginibacter sp.]